MSGPATGSRPLSAITSIRPRSVVTQSMGGRLAIHVDADGAGADGAGADGAPNFEAAAGRVFARVETWAARLTRHTETSDLSRLNADPRSIVPVRPTLAAALLAGREAMLIAPGLVNIALLDARLAAERAAADAALAPRSATPAPAPAPEAWSVARGRRAVPVGRAPGIRFDLGGVGKGWIADRALRLLACMPGGPGALGSAIVDADGDMAVRTAANRFWEIAIDDPRVADGHIAVLRLGGTTARTWGVATSGTSIHRWPAAASSVPAEAPRHHLIDPATGLPARTDIVQASVIAGSALHAEAYAKAAVIAGSARGLAFLDRSPVRGAVLLLENGEVLALPRTLPLLAEPA